MGLRKGKKIIQLIRKYPTCYIKVENENKIIAMIFIKIMGKCKSLTYRRDKILRKAFPWMEKKHPRLPKLKPRTTCRQRTHPKAKENLILFLALFNSETYNFIYLYLFFIKPYTIVVVFVHVYTPAIWNRAKIN